MNLPWDVLGEIAWRFASLSLMAIGGVNALLPEIHRVVVVTELWMNNAEFADTFTLAQIAPGPNMMVVTLIGWKVAGIPGAVVATLAASGPSSFLCYYMTRGWERAGTHSLRATIQRALAPIAIGLILASGLTLARAADHSIGTVALTVAAAATLLLTRFNPVWVIAVGALAGIAGLA